MKKNSVAGTMLLLTGVFFHCGEMPVAGNGGSSETINAQLIISDTLALVTDEHGNSSELVLEAFSSDYHPYEKSGYTASAEGKSLALPHEGTYNFLLRNRENSCRGFVRNVTVAPGGGDSITCILTGGSSVDGRLVAGGSALPDDQYIVSIYGSPFISVTDASKKFTLNGVPVGSYTMNVRPAGKRLFIAAARYTFTTDTTGRRTVLEVVVP